MDASHTVSRARSSSRHGPKTPGTPVRFRVLIDGQRQVLPRKRRRRAGQRHGHATAAVPVDPAIEADRRRQFEIEFLDPDVEAFAVTFG